MTILFVQHVKNEGPGNFMQVLHKHNVPFQILEPSSSVSFSRPSDLRGVIILGGPMNVDQESDYPFLAEETPEKEPECLVWGEKLLLNFLELGKQFLSQTV